MELTKKDLEQQLYIQYKNDKEAFISLINEYFLEINNENEKLRIECTKGPDENDTFPWSTTFFNETKYYNFKKYVDPNNIIERIKKLKQIKNK